MIITISYFLVFFSIFLGLLFLLLRANWHKTLGFLPEKPLVSILIAARNEETNILNCLRAIEGLDYPPERVEVLIGDDNSTDGTHALVSAFIRNKPRFRLFKIQEKLGTAQGKSNVLAHLAKAATSNYFYITDADIEVPAGWVEAMLAAAEPNVGIVTGITTAKGNSFFSRMQRLDWLHSLGLIQVVADLNLPVSTMGNNMLITRAAYESTGGYENLPFSITEDVQLFNAVLLQGFTFRNVYRREVLAFTAPAPDLPALLHQRKRWMKGIMHLPVYLRVLLVFYASFYLVVLPFFWQAPWQYACLALGLKWFFQSFFVQTCLQRVQQKASLKDLVLFEGYQLFTSVTLILFYFLPFKVTWKGRSYKI